MAPGGLIWGPGIFKYRFGRFWGVSVSGCICVSLKGKAARRESETEWKRAQQAERKSGKTGERNGVETGSAS